MEKLNLRQRIEKLEKDVEVFKKLLPFKDFDKNFKEFNQTFKKYMKDKGVD